MSDLRVLARTKNGLQAYEIEEKDYHEQLKDSKIAEGRIT